jgi:hypothetical protein
MRIVLLCALAIAGLALATALGATGFSGKKSQFASADRPSRSLGDFVAGHYGTPAEQR